MYCSRCGTQNEDTASFCASCGQQLVQAAPPPAERSQESVPLRTQRRQGAAPSQPDSKQARAAGRMPAGSIASAGAAIALLLLLFAPWVSCGGAHFSGMEIITESQGEFTWVIVVPFCALATLGILFAFRSRLRVSAFARILTGIAGLITLIKLYAEIRDVASVQWGAVGTVLALAGVIVGATQDLLGEGPKAGGAS